MEGCRLSSNASGAPRPLEGLRVIEMGSLVAGPFAGHLLAEFGAEVIKVEAPGSGDELRTWRYVPPETGTSLFWYFLSRNKKCITLNLKTPEGQDLLRRLVRVSDVVVENFRPGVLARWNLSYDHLREVNPAIIVVSISGYGQTGPYRDKAGFGSSAEALSGIRYLTGYPDRPPVRTGVALADEVAGMYAAVAALMAVYYRDIRGSKQGQHIDVALYEAMFSFMDSLVPDYDVTGVIRQPAGTSLGMGAPSNLYRTKDNKYVHIGANNDNTFRRCMEAIGRPDLAEDPRFQSNHGRVKEVRFLDGVIEDWTQQHTMQEVCEVMDRAGVPTAPIYTAEDIVKDPHYRAREMLLELTVPGLGPVKFPGVVPKFSLTPGRVEWLGPALGEHNRDVYQGLLGLSERELEGLREKGVI